MQHSTKTLLALLPLFIQANAQTSGTGTTTRYWDCCKPSCAWPGKASLLTGSNPVTTCSIDDQPLTDHNTASGCDGGGSTGAYMCSSESPWAVSSDLAYGYAEFNIAGGGEASWCCACYELTFTSGAVAGKKMIVQATKTGGDLGSNQFDISIPGGGVGIFNGWTDEWGAPSSGWGAQYGGISAASDCSTFPTALQPGCNWRFGWLEGTDNPTVSFTQVECPAAITAKSGCTRADDSGMPAPAPDSSSKVVAGTTTSSTEVVVVTTSTAEVAVAPVSTSADPVVDLVPTSAEPVSSSADSVATSSTDVVTSSPPTTSADPVVVTASSSPPVIFVTSTLDYKYTGWKHSRFGFM